jgi:hypothetical protein
MLISNIITEAAATGRPFNHLEDLVLFHGSAGATQSLQRLQDVMRQPQAVRWKWDGKPQVYWGREPDGTFIMTGHNGWLKPDGTGKTTKPADLAKFIMNTGKATTDDQVRERQQFATEFASLWSLFEAATPANFRGYVYGDLLYMRRPAVANGKFIFTPNQVTYSVDANSDLGKRIAGSTAAVVGHAYFSDFGLPDRTQQPIDDFDKFNQNAGLIVMGPKHVQPQKMQVNTAGLKQIAALTQAHAADIDRFLSDDTLGVNKMSNFKNVLYKFNNQQVRAGVTTGLAAKFPQWLAGSGESVPMQQKITNWMASNPKGYAAVFAILEGIRQLKDQIITQLDQQQGDVQQSTGGQPGGEGYVLYNPEGNVKLVPRHRWAPH